MPKKETSSEVSSIAAQYMNHENPHIRRMAASLLSQDETTGQVAATKAPEPEPEEGIISPWMPETDPLTLAIIGKLAEEAGEVSVRCARIVCQGLHSLDPASGRTNLQELEREIADVLACIAIKESTLGHAPDEMLKREQRKYQGFRKWHYMIREALKGQRL